MLQDEAQNPKWPTSGPVGYITHAVWGVPYAPQRGTKSEVARTWDQWLHGLALWGFPDAAEQGTKSVWATSGPGGYITLAVLGSPLLQSGGQNQKWPTTRPTGHKTPARGPWCFLIGNKIRSGTQVGPVAT